jgi:hypothetical protein
MLHFVQHDSTGERRISRFDLGLERTILLSEKQFLEKYC